jgi:arginase
VNLHLDLDVLDPEVWPAVPVPAPDGMSVDDVARAIRAVRSHWTLVGVGITDYLPSVPHDIEILASLLGALSLRTRPLISDAG